MIEKLKEMDRQVDELKTQIRTWHNDNADSVKLAEITGIGPITASAIVVTMSDTRKSSKLVPGVAQRTRGFVEDSISEFHQGQK